MMKQLIEFLLPRRPSPAIHLVSAIVAGLIFASADAHAVSSDWVETEGGRIRITALPPSPDGVIRAILDVDLLPGWKTYWRDPGDAGIPPSIRFEGSANIGQSQLAFPAPERIDDGYSVWAGYTDPVAFPLTLTQDRAGATSVLEAQVFLGICKTICIPLQSDFSLTLGPDNKANSFEERIVDKAYSQIPEQPGNGFKVLKSSFSKQDNALSISVAHPTSKTDLELFLTGPSGWYFDIPKRVSGDDVMSEFRIPVIDAPEGKTISGEQLQILVKTAARSMETTFNVP